MEIENMNKMGYRFFSVLFPLVSALAANRLISIDQKKESNARDERIQNTIHEIEKHELDSLQKMLDDVYNTELQRKSSMEVKGSALIGAAAIAVSVISISLGVYNGDSISFLSSEILGNAARIILAYAVIHLITAGISTLPVFETYPYYLPTASRVRNAMSEQNKGKEMLHWIAEKLVGIELNERMIQKLNNWVSAAGRHFVHGLIAMAVAYFILYSAELTSGNSQDSIDGATFSESRPQITYSLNIRETLSFDDNSVGSDGIDVH